MTFGERLYELRDKKYLTKTQLAKDLGTTRQLIAMYENGKTIPNISFFAIIADYFGVSADYILGREDYIHLTHNKKKNCVFLPDGLTKEDYKLIKDFINIMCERRLKNEQKH